MLKNIQYIKIAILFPTYGGQNNGYLTAKVVGVVAAGGIKVVNYPTP
jgi:hypothetical protein